MINTLIFAFQNPQIFTSLIKQHDFNSLIKQHVYTSLIKQHKVFTSLYHCPKNTNQNLIKVHKVLAPEQARMVLSVFLACMFLDNDNFIKM